MIVLLYINGEFEEFYSLWISGHMHVLFDDVMYHFHKIFIFQIVKDVALATLWLVIKLDTETI